MRRCLLILLLLGQAAGADVVANGREFRRLRLIRGHFQGGTWDKEVDSAQGSKGRVMGELARELRDSTAERIIQVMGPPDARVGAGSPEWSLIKRKAGAYALIYEWRGRHDFLYFLCDDDGHVLFADWWAALE